MVPWPGPDRREPGYAARMAGATAEAKPSRPMRVLPFTPKITPPSVRPGTVCRESLVHRLCASDATEIVISAPAGYGKSTLVTLWGAADERSFGWMSADAGDNDPVVLLTYLALALDSIHRGGARLADELSAASLPWSQMLPVVTDAVATMPVPFVLVVDDAHHLEGPSGTEVLPSIARRVPPGSALVISTRSRAPYPAIRGRITGRTLQLDAQDLAMDTDESGALLRAAGAEMTTQGVGALHEKTEGWPAGLYISALALRGADDADQAVREFTGADRVLTDYVAEEILATLGEDDVDFLLSTSALTRLSGDLCDEVLGVTGSGARLARLTRDNWFVIPMDHHGGWYRYHHLFGEVLQGEMHARAPMVVHRVAGQASAWFEQRGELEAAVEHALVAHDEHAAALIWRHSPRMLATNRVDTVALWLAQYTEQQIETIPELAITAAWERLTVGDMVAMHRLTDALERVADHRLPDGSPVEAVVAILHALTRTDGLSAMRLCAGRARATLPQFSPYQVIAHFLEGSAATYLDDLASARELLVEGIRLGRDVLPAVHAQCLAQLARVEVAEHDMAQADRLVDEAVRVIEEHRVGDRAPTCVCFAIASVLHLRRGLTALGEAERARGLALLEQAEDLSPYQLLGVRLDLAQAAVLAGDLTGAEGLLHDAERKLMRFPDTGTLDAAAVTVRAMLRSASTPKAALVEPLSPAELRVLSYLPTHLNFSEIGELLFVSRNTVKSHAIAIYRKLGVSSRSAAVAEARDHGLLDA